MADDAQDLNQLAKYIEELKTLCALKAKLGHLEQCARRSSLEDWISRLMGERVTHLTPCAKGSAQGESHPRTIDGFQEIPEDDIPF